MKFVLSIIASLLFASIGFANCIDLSGEYSNGYDSIGREKVISLKQNGCASLDATLFVFNWSTGIKEDETMPIVYVESSNTNLCPHPLKKCTTFVATEDKLTLNLSGTIAISGFSCRYNQVEWSLNEEKWVQTYLINDKRPKCKNTKTVSREFEKFQEAPNH